MNRKSLLLIATLLTVSLLSSHVAWATDAPRQCWISAGPDEKSVCYMMEYIGSEQFFWASDFPPDDHTCDYIRDLAELVAPMSEQSRTNFLGANVARVYGLS